jgi:hypothetical protein
VGGLKRTTVCSVVFTQVELFLSSDVLSFKRFLLAFFLLISCCSSSSTTSSSTHPSSSTSFFFNLILTYS